MKIFFVTDSEQFFGQRAHPWQSLNVPFIVNKLKEHFDVEEVQFEQIANSAIDIENGVVIYSSSQQPEYKQYIEDILIYLSQKGNTLIPSLNSLKSHENKGYQELHKKLLGIEAIPANYLGHHKELKGKDLDFPAVFKFVDGYGSGSVSMVSTKEEATSLSSKKEWAINKFLFRKIRTIIARPVKRYLLGKKVKVEDTKDYFHFFRRFVLQRLVPNLQNDYKVLVYHDKYYVLTRYTRPNDFRASGSGLFKFEEASEGLLNYAQTLFKQFDEPMMAFDICFDGNDYHLIEFQATHFGPYTLTESPGYFIQQNETWNFKEGKSDLDKEVSNALVAYLKKLVP